MAGAVENGVQLGACSSPFEQLAQLLQHGATGMSADTGRLFMPARLVGCNLFGHILPLTITLQVRCLQSASGIYDLDRCAISGLCIPC